MESTADERVVNNVMRHGYRILSEEEKLQVRTTKDLGAQFVQSLTEIERLRGRSRELSIAREKMEEAVFWAVKFITG